MFVELQLNSFADSDLVALAEAGYPLSSMTRNAIIAYAHGEALHYQLDNVGPYLQDRKYKLRYRIKISEADTITCSMLEGIIPGQRNNFLKSLLRNTFVQQNLTCFFVDSSYDGLGAANLQTRNIRGFYNVVSCFDTTSEKGDSTVTAPAPVRPLRKVTASRKPSVTRKKEPASEPAPMTPIHETVTAPAQPIPAPNMPPLPSGPSGITQEQYETLMQMMAQMQNQVQPQQSPQVSAPEPEPPKEDSAPGKITLAQNDELLSLFDSL